MKTIYILIALLMMQFAFAQTAIITQSPIPVHTQGVSNPQITNSSNASQFTTTSIQAPITQNQTMMGALQQMQQMLDFLPMVAIVVVAIVLIALLYGLVAGIGKSDIF